MKRIPSKEYLNPRDKRIRAIQSLYSLMEEGGSTDIFVTGATYDSETKKISFVNDKGEEISSIDATAFIKDGMVDSVEVVNNNLVITFNTEAGKEDISIPIYKFSTEDTLVEIKGEIENTSSTNYITGYYIKASQDHSGLYELWQLDWNSAHSDRVWSLATPSSHVTYIYFTQNAISVFDDRAVSGYLVCYNEIPQNVVELSDITLFDSTDAFISGTALDSLLEKNVYKCNIKKNKTTEDVDYYTSIIIVRTYNSTGVPETLVTEQYLLTGDTTYMRTSATYSEGSSPASWGNWEKISMNSTEIANLINQKISITEVTYAQLSTLKSNNQLIPGAKYRITDYVTTTAQENTQSAGHQFDIIVQALSTNELDENARAIKHNGDSYFSDCNLNAWEIKYCLDNDTDRFAWADTTNGKGVIYYMKDEWNNECPYDFKNIQFKRWAVGSVSRSSFATDVKDASITDIGQQIAGEYLMPLSSNISPFGYVISAGVSTDIEWMYTFTHRNPDNDEISDMSIIWPTLENDEGGPNEVRDNCIKPKIQDDFSICYKLNNVVFFANLMYESEGFSNNIISGTDSTFYRSCNNNELYVYKSILFVADTLTGSVTTSYIFSSNICKLPGLSTSTMNNSSNVNILLQGTNSCFFNNISRSTIEFLNNSVLYNITKCTIGFVTKLVVKESLWHSHIMSYTNEVTIDKDANNIIVESSNNKILLTTTASPTSTSNAIRNITIAQGCNNSNTTKTISHNTLNDTFQTIYRPTNSVEVYI